MRVSLIISSLLITLASIFWPIIASANGHLDRAQFEYSAKEKVNVDAKKGFDSPFLILKFTPSAFATMDPSLRDLRIFSGNEELGYARLPFHAGDETVSKTEENLELMNKGSFPDGKYSFVIALEDRLKIVSSTDVPLLEVKLDREPYLVKGTLYGSQNNRDWQMIKPVTLYSIDNRFNTIPVDNIDYEYLKLDYTQPPGESLAVQAASLITQTVKIEDQHSSWVDAPIETTENGKETEVVLDLQYVNRVSSEWVIETLEKGFHREVIVEGSNDKNEWERIGSTFIYRGIEPEDEKLSYQYDSRYYRYLRLTMMNNDNQPVPITSAKVRTHSFHVIVKSPSSIHGNTVTLTALWGNETIKPPTYDVRKMLDKINTNNYVQVEIGNYVENREYEKELAPLTERYPFLLPAGLMFAALIVGFLLYRNIKKI